MLAKQRDALQLAEQLFDLDVTHYPLLVEVNRQAGQLASAAQPQPHVQPSPPCALPLPSRALAHSYSPALHALPPCCTPRPRRSCGAWAPSMVCTVSMPTR
jgi:hypothetical protein